MNTVPLLPPTPLPPCCPDDDLQQLMASARTILDQPPPPTLREILAAYRSKGDGDRDMLLAMLNAKSAEDQRLASLAFLQRSVLDVYQSSQLQPPQPPHHVVPPPPLHPGHHYPHSLCPSPHPYERKSRRSHHHPHQFYHPPPDSRAPLHPRHHSSLAPSEREILPLHLDHHHPRKRHRLTASHVYPPHSSSHEQLPPSPYSSSSRSGSADFSPRSRSSMAIGSLLTPGPSSRTVDGDDP